MIYRGRTNEIIFEFSIPETPKGTIILCDGFPSVPKQKELMNQLRVQGYAAVYPRYQGTWESGGEFLAKSPTDDINSMVDLIKKGAVTELYANKQFMLIGPVYVLGSSFGGSIALCLTDNPAIDKIVSLSPIVDFKTHNKNSNEQNLLWLKSFIQQAFNMSYRFSDENWSKMVAGGLFNPPQKFESERTSHILIAYDLSDKEVNHNSVIRYCTQNSINTVATENVGHLSFSKIPDSLWKRISDFLL
jgi:alpha-beta hydrolase superfamily lysophospholipase